MPRYDATGGYALDSNTNQSFSLSNALLHKIIVWRTYRSFYRQEIGFVWQRGASCYGSCSTATFAQTSRTICKPYRCIEIAIKEQEYKLAKSITFIAPRRDGSRALNGSLTSRVKTLIQAGAAKSPSPTE